MGHPILDLINKPSRLVIGFMSGTSADGIDAALVRISGSGTDTKVQQLAFFFSPFAPEVRAEILRLAGGAPAAAADFCRINFLLGRLCSEAGLELCRQAGLAPGDIDLIGNHGQTFWHIPAEEEYLGRQIRSTLQLGEDAVLAETFGCPVAGDFRVRDMAAGGLGAPLVPYTEFLLYRSETECVALQNIGGIGNISFLPAGCTLDGVLAFDTGPGNMVIDAVVSRMTGGRLSYDDGGRLAAEGQINPALLGRMLDDEYLRRRPPKTTGRERYGPAYVQDIMDFAARNGISDSDTLATVTRFTAECIAAAIRGYAPEKPARLIAGGGGCMNATLMSHIRALLPGCRVMTNEELGFDGNAKEAVAFAILANETIFASCNNAPSATGAGHPVVMGKISL